MYSSTGGMKGREIIISNENVSDNTVMHTVTEGHIDNIIINEYQHLGHID